MAIRNIGKNKWKISVTQRIKGKPNKTIKRNFTGSKFEAIQKENEFRLELKKYVDAQERSLTIRNSEFKTFGECLEYYKETYSIKKPANFRRLEQHLYSSRLTVEVGEQGVWDDLLSFRDFMLSEEFSPATTNRNTVLAQAVITNAFKNRKIPINYLSGFGQIKEHNKCYKTLTNNEKYELFKYLPEHIKPLVYVAMRIPTRISELLMLTIDHISEDCTMITLKDGETKGDAGRWLPIFPEMKPYFQSVMKNNWKYVFSKDGSKSLGFFSNKDGTYQLPSTAYKLFNTACSKAGIEGFNFHKTRQQSAMQFLYDGFSEKETMRIGGWSTIEAFNRYVYVDDVLLKKKLGIFTDDDTWKQDLAPKPF